jgi:hypothetical protein
VVGEEIRALGLEKHIHPCAQTKALQSALADGETWPEKWWLRWISSADGSGGGKVWFLLDWVWISASRKKDSAQGSKKLPRQSK